MINLPYIALRLIRRSLPSPIAYRLLSNDSRHPEGFMETGLQYLDLLKAHNVNVAGAVAAESGPGTYGPAGLALLNAGAKKVLLQEPFLRRIDPDRLKSAVRKFWEFLGGRIPAALPWENLFAGEGYHPDRVELQSVAAHQTGCADNSIGLLVSCSVLEHIRDIPPVFREEFRILKPGGALLHLVDLRDHFFKYPFEMLTFSRFVWEKVLTSPGKGSGYQNRLRADDYMSLLKASGFVRCGMTVLAEDAEGCRKIKPRLHRDFQGKGGDVLAVARICLYAEKP
jgi:SAM-dependent methyltransferase